MRVTVFAGVGITATLGAFAVASAVGGVMGDLAFFSGLVLTTLTVAGFVAAVTTPHLFHPGRAMPLAMRPASPHWAIVPSRRCTSCGGRRLAVGSMWICLVCDTGG